jgi:hypothetical protein
MMDDCSKNLMTEIRKYESLIDKSTGDRLGYLLRLDTQVRCEVAVAPDVPSGLLGRGG